MQLPFRRQSFELLVDDDDDDDVDDDDGDDDRDDDDDYESLRDASDGRGARGPK